MARTKGVRDVATWQMTPVELARIFAEHFGYTTSHRSNCVHSPAGRAVAQGWTSFAGKLVQLGYLKPGIGVDWRRAGEHPRVTWAHTEKRGV